MTYLDHGATSFPKLPQVRQAVLRALTQCANPGRGGHRASMTGAKEVFLCRKRAAELFACQPEQVVFTGNCTHGLNIAIHDLFSKGDPVVISGFEHNAVLRPLSALGAEIRVAGTRLFDPEDTVRSFEAALQKGVKGAVFTHCSNVFGYVLPVERLAELCKRYGVPFVLDAAQSAGTLPLNMKQLGADYIAMPGHKGLQGPMGTGILLCGRVPKPLMQGGTGSLSQSEQMPDFLPDVAEAGTLNVPGIAGLSAGLAWVLSQDLEQLHRRETELIHICADGLESRGFRVFSAPEQGAALSFTGNFDCEELAQQLSKDGIAVRAGLHCAPLAHQSAGTLETGTVRISVGPQTQKGDIYRLLSVLNARV